MLFPKIYLRLKSFSEFEGSFALSDLFHVVSKKMNFLALHGSSAMLLMREKIFKIFFFLHYNETLMINRLSAHTIRFI